MNIEIQGHKAPIEGNDTELTSDLGDVIEAERCSGCGSNCGGGGSNCGGGSGGPGGNCSGSCSGCKGGGKG